MNGIHHVAFAAATGTEAHTHWQHSFPRGWMFCTLTSMFFGLHACSALAQGCNHNDWHGDPLLFLAKFPMHYRTKSLLCMYCTHQGFSSVFWILVSFTRPPDKLQSPLKGNFPVPGFSSGDKKYLYIAKLSTTQSSITFRAEDKPTIKVYITLIMTE